MDRADRRQRLIAASACLIVGAAAPSLAASPAPPAAKASPTQPPPPAPSPAESVAADACLAPLPADARPGPVFRNTRLAVSDTPGGTEFSLGGCVLDNAAAGSFAGFLINGLIFDHAGNLLVSATMETNPVPSAAPSAATAVQPPEVQSWAMSANAGYRIAHDQVRPTLLLIVYSRACPDGAPAGCASRSFDNGPFYLMQTACTAAGAKDAAALCPASAPAKPSRRK
jgi:hypothetical protein